MRKILLIALSAITFSSCDVLQNLPQTTGSYGKVTEAEAGQGIKEALSQGLVKAVLQLNKQDGFYGDGLYKILLPPDAVKAENTLRSIGLGSLVDKAVLQINRGAEDAVGYAQPIFVSAIQQMTLADALNIIKGGDTSITHFFREKTTVQLTAAFLPSIKNSLEKVDATKYYGDIVTRYNSIPLVFNKINPDLPAFVTQQATNALFEYFKESFWKWDYLFAYDSTIDLTTEVLSVQSDAEFRLSKNLLVFLSEFSALVVIHLPFFFFGNIMISFAKFLSAFYFLQLPFNYKRCNYFSCIFFRIITKQCF
ncbi:MAG: DUF4197 domain-containing protein [Sphingobacteriales bacterium]|nr:DUF4197 domain-containing protein [Sphingobacteriales bacterium]